MSLVLKVRMWFGRESSLFMPQMLIIYSEMQINSLIMGYTACSNTEVANRNFWIQMTGIKATQEMIGCVFLFGRKFLNFRAIIHNSFDSSYQI